MKLNWLTFSWSKQNFQLLSCFLCFQYGSSINILDTKNLQLNYILNNFGKQIYQHKRYLTLTFFVELFFTLKFSCEVLSLHLAVGLYCSLSLSLSLSHLTIVWTFLFHNQINFLSQLPTSLDSPSTSFATFLIQLSNSFHTLSTSLSRYT